MSLIEIRDVHKWYGEFHVLKGISERVEKGEVLVICGPSGSGKSSLIRCLNRLEPIQKGDILSELDGRTVANMEQLQDILQYYAAGETVPVVVQRSSNGQYAAQTLNVTLGSAPDTAAANS